ncbi:SWI/SNF complex subunit SWI3C isoform X2 [Hevea brasiliensis]|uniref:SWI/SNF complex subunit SWI3C isoform X2 n=1 Tax=Hevea brasiliensis TaxID=3981 RepID=UPI0025FF3127|nr:SWI/SNF complex subunit SWI3C isoform X2 [Hevea brasiliensis]
MPASPPFHSDGRGKWKRRKRDPQITRKQHPKHEHEDPDDEGEDDAVEDYNNNNHLDDDSEDPNLPQSAALPDPNHLKTEVIADGEVRICDFPSVTKLAVNRPHESVFAIVALERANLIGANNDSCRGQVPNFENVSYGQLQAVSTVPAEGFGSDQERNDGGNSAYVVTPPPNMEGKGVVKRFGTRVHVVPMHSDWFSPSTVNRLERQVVPHFFCGKSLDHTPEKYMECRNYVVAKYMENPGKRITVSDFQGLVVGTENEDLARIVRFLDHWGIINYCAAPPSCESWNGGSYLREDPNGEVHAPSAALKSIDSLIKFDKPKCRLKAADIYSSLSCHDDDFSDLDNRIRERISENCCTYCSQHLPGIYFQSQKEIDVLLCSDCFHEGRFVTNHSSLDFIKMDATKDYSDLDGESWSDQETLLLLEAMEVYNENWNEIAEHVGTKSKSQCILHFLRLPMENGLLENIEVRSMSKSSNLSSRDNHGMLRSQSNGSCLQDADAESRIPFANSGNPVMSLVAFLASAVGPRVAAACAHASLAALSEDNRVNSEKLHGREGNFQGEVANSIQPKDNVHGSQVPNEAEGVLLSAEKVKAAAKAGLAAAATKAKLFADHEEREIQRLSANIINHQLKRLELKLKQFAEVETFLMRECEQVEKTRQRFAAERARILSTQIGPAGATSQMNLGGVSPSMVSNNVGSSRQQLMPTSSSQPSISGYGNNQQVHPHIPFVQRGQPQPMFPLGPRLPLAAIQPSSSVPSNAVFNASGNSQPSLNQMLRSVSGPSSGLG